jgi:hypothetical protein
MKSAIYDFLFATHVFFIDDEPWPLLIVQFLGIPIKIHKPITDQSSHSVPGSIGNERLDVYSTIVRLELSSDAPPDGHLLYPLTFQCLAWVKILTRQYWVGLAGSGTTSVRGSSLVTDMVTSATVPTNFGGFNTPIIAQPLSRETWEQVGWALTSAQFPRSSDLIFCNGLLALRDGGLQEAIALLGIACEIELNECLEFFLSGRKDPVTDLLYKRIRVDFKWKLNNLLPMLCGKKFSEDVPQWYEPLLRLYETRGSAVHDAASPDMVRNAPRFVLAADSFLKWSHCIRSAHGEQLGPCPLSVQATVGPV